MPGGGQNVPVPADAGHVLPTGQRRCYDEAGAEAGCAGSGQDAEWHDAVLTAGQRFEPGDQEVMDRLTGLYWLKDAAIAGFPLSWRESLDYIATMNRERAGGRADWRLPNRRELGSLLDHGEARPALPSGHPFEKVERTWYWTSTSAAINPAHAWYVNLDGARMFYGAKDQYFMLWPVRGEGNGRLAATGQQHCYDERGMPVDCRGSGQDGESRYGTPWPQPRFEARGEIVRDCLTGLEWRREASLSDGPVSWTEALAAVAALNRADPGAPRPWRLPDINELESLVDSARARPALPAGHPFTSVRETYWSATTSQYETGWAWALYLEKGACGVGRKPGRYFSAWAVRDGAGRGR